VSLPSTPTVTHGAPYPMGVTLKEGGINIAVASRHATGIVCCLFDDKGESEIARVPLAARTGDIFHGHIGGVKQGARYGLRAHGPYAPADGHHFNPHKLLVDPHAALIDRPFAPHPSQFGYVPGGDEANPVFNETDSAPFTPKGIVCEALALLSPEAFVPWRKTVIYEMHVRGFTKVHPDVPEALRGTFSGLAHPAVLEYLRDLGVTTLELLPTAAWIDERHLGPLKLTNYWGYNPVLYGAPDPRLAPGGWEEIRNTTRACEAAGLEVILDIVLNHSGEEDSHGPTLSLRGLDHAGSYRLRPDDHRYLINDAGCGNTLALERPAMLQLGMDSLRRWAQWGGVHGFRLDLAATLGRRDSGFDPDHPFLQAMVQDPVLRRLKIIAEPWDIGPGGYQLGNFPASWGEWNDHYRDTARRFWRGEDGMLGEMATRFAGSADIFGARNRPLTRGINFLTAHDGFTLADLVSHESKHNEANGENNKDGTDANHSWNNGVEGQSDDPAIMQARQRDAEALLATLLLSRGTPMLSMGDERGRGQRGNNNAYAQDNAISWLDWSTADVARIALVRQLIAIRMANPALHDDTPLTGKTNRETGFADVKWLTAGGSPMQAEDWQRPENRTLIAQLHAGAEGANSVLMVLHAGRDDIKLTLPAPAERHRWVDGTMEHTGFVHQAEIRAGSVRLLLERPMEPDQA
jgi:glycogen debranching enzyme GlgX